MLIRVMANGGSYTIAANLSTIICYCNAESSIKKKTTFSFQQRQRWIDLKKSNLVVFLEYIYIYFLREEV